MTTICPTCNNEVEKSPTKKDEPQKYTCKNCGILTNPNYK